MHRIRTWLMPVFRSAAVIALCVFAQAATAQSPAREPVKELNSAVGTPLRYDVQVRVDGGDRELLAAIRESSVLVQHQTKGAHNTATLAARARADEKQLVAALYEQARYGGSLRISIAGKPLDEVDISAATKVADQPVPVEIAVSPGPIFRFGKISVGVTRQTEGQPRLPPEEVGLIGGEVARSPIIAAALNRITQRWHAAGFPLANIREKEIVADHARQLIDVKIIVAPGPQAVFGWINVTGTKRLNSRAIATQSALRSGKRYNPDDLDKARERLRKLESIESVRIVEGKQVDGHGGIPITIAIQERKPRYVGATASVTTFDGAEVKAEWGHRNLFRSGEHLHVEGAVSQIGTAPLDELEFDVSATLTKPGVLDIDTNFFTQFRIAREANDVFLSDTALAKAGFTRRFSPRLAGSIAVESRYTREENEFGETDHALISLPGDIEYDTRDNRLDPSMGVHSSMQLAPVLDVSNSVSFLAGRVDIAGYWALDPEAHAIVAARVGVGTILGGSLRDVPSTYRFLAGGGGSVRGYEYRSLGPTIDGIVVGGLSIASASIELRLRPTRQIGIVPFLDVATVSSDRIPKFSDTAFVGAGLGLRYYTALGPIRLDAAVPLTNKEDRPSFGVYVGLGQSF